MDCWTSGQTVWLTDGLSDQWTDGLARGWTIGPVDRLSGSRMDCWTRGQAVWLANEQMDCPTLGWTGELVTNVRRDVLEEGWADVRTGI